MSTLVFACPGCGSNIKHEDDGKDYTCPYCKRVLTFDEIKRLSEDKINANKEKAISDLEKEMSNTSVIYTCKNCGAEITTNENTAATFCLYCHSSNVIQSRLVEVYTPDKIIPFKINEQDAKEAFNKWTSTIKFLPDDFVSEDHIDKIRGLYAPFWLFDINADFELHARVSEITTRTTGNYRYRKESIYEINQAGNMLYETVPVDASLALEDETMALLEPYDYNELVDFEVAYLIGNYAEKYDENQDDLYKGIEPDLYSNVNIRMKGSVNKYSNVRINKEESKINVDDAKYAFFPVWFLNYHYENKDYKFTINGQTGKVVGEFPIDKIKQRNYMLKNTLIAFVVFVAIISGLVFGGIL
ncbi:hypothetical protein [Breznakia pachnodae]|uniref:DNA-directed RNA polymerase subunit RPC12/RpoP n=1 Tax=Breznakia pachnodae TaxID=265178 RepID=A0ABU0E3Q9_9FIRM|nr:hypothetical protein [Breznakia pachnodae]MDQ0361328.1 DNA-directed RNA polymerase subunit RPC12/RpoP [Breznakia pachnodae]